jgi:hypothetical protein
LATAAQRKPQEVASTPLRVLKSAVSIRLQPQELAWSDPRASAAHFFCVGTEQTAPFNS